MRQAVMATWVGALIANALIIGCDRNPTQSTGSADSAAVAIVSLNFDSTAVNEFGMVQLNATLKDSAGNILYNRTVEWSSSVAAIASVSSTGLVSALSPGKALIAASSEGKSDTAIIVVVPEPVASVELNPASGHLWVGEALRLTAIVRDSGGNVLAGRQVSWVSNQTTVATVSATGAVMGKSVGKVLITARLEGQSASAAFDVVPNINGRWAGTSQQIWFGGQIWSAGSFSLTLSDPGTEVVTGSGIQTLSTNYQFTLEITGENKPEWIRLTLKWFAGDEVRFDGRWKPGATGSFCGTLIYPDGKLFPLCLSRQ